MQNFILKYFLASIYLMQAQNFVCAHFTRCHTPLNDVGECVSLKFCPEVPLFFKTLPHYQAVAYSRVLKNICGNRLTMDRFPLVCCTKPNYNSMPNPGRDIILIIEEDEPDEREFEPITKPPPLPKEKPDETTTTSWLLPKDKIAQKSCENQNNQRGICKPLENCTTLLNKLLEDPNDENFKTFLRSSHESCESTATEICCTDAPTYQPRPPPPPTRTQTTPTSRSRMKPPTEEQNCGHREGSIFTKVVGGEDSNPGDWPWIALLGYDPHSTHVFRCGGTLVTARHVVTAAHCILDELSFVRLGEHDLSRVDDMKHVDVDIEKSIVHEQYSRRAMRNDLALLCLVKDVDFNTYIRPICLPMSAQMREKSFVAHTPFAAGWGRTTENGETANILQQVQLLVHENYVCQDAFKRVLRSKGAKVLTTANFDGSVICAGDSSGGKDTCKGDSGGPLMIAEPYKGSARFYLIGVVSYGIGCARADLPAIYTSTQFFMDWILAKIQEN